MSTMRFTTGATSIDVEQPEFGYRSIISLPFDINRLSNGLYAVYDAGATYDVRYCDCDFVLSAAEASSLLEFIDTTARGLATMTMTLTSGRGFYPFGADKGDAGTWTVSLEILHDIGVGVSPYLYHKISVRIINQSTHPAYSLPSQVSEGSVTLGSIANLRFPQGWFQPTHELGIYPSTGRGGATLYVDRSANADAHGNSFVLTCNQSKSAALINYLTGTARANTFSLTTVDNQYAFGMRSGSADTYTVRLVQNEIVAVNTEYNLWDIELALSREAIV